MWTSFRDMHSGGSRKLQWDNIFIEAPEEEAKLIFYNRFDRHPFNITCDCCGEDYSVSEYKSLEQATGFYRGCIYASRIDNKGGVYVEPGNKMPHCCERTAFKGYRSYINLYDYISKPDVLVITRIEIEPHEREGTLPILEDY